MFLTTNIYARIDSAVLDRIHLGMKYEMDKIKREKISKTFFEWYEEKGLSFGQTVQLEFQNRAEKHDFNGREIRNGRSTEPLKWFMYLFVS